MLGLAGGWVIVDWLEGRERAGFVRWFHAAPGTRCEALASDAFRLWTPSGRAALVVRDLGRAPTLWESTRAAAGVGPYSERYGREVPAPVLRFTDDAPLPAVRVTLLGVEHDGRPGLRSAPPTGRGADGTLRLELTDARGAAAALTVRPTLGNDAEPRLVFERDSAGGGVRYRRP